MQSLPEPIVVLYVGTVRELADQVVRALSPHPVDMRFERGLNVVMDRFERDDFDLLLVCSHLMRNDERESVELLDLIRAKNPGTPTLVFVFPERMRATQLALRGKPFPAMTVPVSDEALREQIRALVESRPRAGPGAAVPSAAPEGGLARLMGRSAAMRSVYRQIRQAAATDIPVLLTGDTGCGKELAAHAIYEQSARSDQQYLPVHIGSLPPGLVADELLGHEKGAYTNAVQRKPGCFERAHGGTVFLDEISTMDQKMQISLLRILEHQEFTRLGGQTPVRVDVRLIAASNQDLPELVREGHFREDLYYRLDVMHIELPPLRERHGDIPVLVEHFLAQCNRSFGKNIQGLSPDFLACLENYDWPGNVRELKNTIQRATVLCEENILTPKQLPRRILEDSARQRTFPVKVGSSLADVERELIRNTLRYTGQNRTRTAEVLGISRRALYNKMARYGL